MIVTKVIEEFSETFAGEVGCQHCDYTEIVQDMPKATEYRDEVLPTKYCPSCQKNASGRINPEIVALLGKQQATGTVPLQDGPTADPDATPDEEPPILDDEGNASEIGSTTDNTWP